MSPLRLLRILLPIGLLGFVVVMAIILRGHPARRSVQPDQSSDQAARMEGFRFTDLVLGRRRLLVEAKVGRVEDDGAFEIEEAQRVEVDREGQGPLVMSAPHGAGSGAQGKRVVRLEGGVTLKDDTGFGLEIPSVEIDQVKGEVRSVGVVRLKNETWNGVASRVLYDLNGAPTQLWDLDLEGPNAGRLTADRGSVPAGSRSLTLTGSVSASQGGMTFHADNVVLMRGASGKLESVTASPEVQGETAAFGGGAAGFEARQVNATWNQAGTVESVHLSGSAKIKHVRGTMSADTIDAKALDPAGSFAVNAAGQVAASGPTPKGAGRLSCDALSAIVSAKGSVHDGSASGHVRFDGDGTAGEAAEARFTSLDADGMVTLRAASDRRARLAFQRTRVIADTIVSDVRGVRMRAEGHVESTLLPAEGTRAAATSPMFSGTEAVHFVSASLDSADSGAHLVFHGDVRGWQGERTLSADDVDMVQAGEILNAHGHVSTRMPREATRAATEADFVQVSSERLSYRGGEHAAEYEGSVTIRQAEGWLRTPRLVATLADGGPGLREIHAQEGVRFEYRAVGENGVPTTATGDGDRAVYETTARVLHVYGDKAPATVRSTGAKAGTTVGRVLRYDLDSGALEVESGERDRATIRTPKK